MNDKWCYLICSALDDLPVACFDRYAECTEYLSVSSVTFWRMLRYGLVHDGFYVEKVFL